MLLGTIVNAVAIVVGSLVGIVIHKRFPERIKVIAFQGMGIATLVIGIQMALQVQNILVFIFSILAGGILGELLGLEMRLDVLMQKVQKHFSSADDKAHYGVVSSFYLYPPCFYQCPFYLDTGFLKCFLYPLHLSIDAVL